MRVFSSGGGGGGAPQIAPQVLKMRGASGNFVFQGSANVNTLSVNTWRNVLTLDGKFLLMGIWQDSANASQEYEGRFIDKDTLEPLITYERSMTGATKHRWLGYRFDEPANTDKSSGGIIVENVTFQLRTLTSTHHGGSLGYEVLEIV